MNGLASVFRREFAGYFATPLAVIFIVIFLFLSGLLTFYAGGFFEAGDASLKSFFLFHPWLYLFLIPAVSMRLWAEEQKSGTIELLLTLPVPLWAVVLGKFLAAWAFSLVALALTFPIWITVNYLGDPDNGVILASYIGSALMAGAYLSIGACISATTRNQVIAFVITVSVCFLFTVSGLPMVLDFFAAWAPKTLLQAIASFSFLSHFDAITNGVIDLRDLAYFASLTAAWLYANGIVLDMNRSGHGGGNDIRASAALGLTAIIFLAFNILANATLYAARFDLTQDRLYTLNPVTRKVLSDLAEPIRLTFYYSESLAKDVPGAQNYGQRVRDMLKEFEENADGKLLLEIIDPQPFSVAEEQASKLGLQGLPTESGDKFYLGLAAYNMLDGEQVIPFFTQEREQFLEYDLTQLISQLNNPEKPKVAVLSGLPLDIGKGGIEAVMRGEIKPFMLYQQIRDNFDAEMLTGQFAEISSKYDVLLIVHPKEMDALTAYAVDQYVLKGGRVIAFTDPVSEVAKPPARTKNPLTSRESFSPSSALPELYRAWGVEMDPNRVVADRENALRVVVDNLGQQQQLGYVAWLGLHERALNHEDPVTAQLQYVTMAMAGHLRKLPDATTQFTPLISSSGDSELIEADMMLRRAPNPMDLLRNFKPTGEKYVLAARISGESVSAFPKGPPPLPGEASPELQESYKALPPHVEKSAKPINVIVVADTDLWDDNWWVEVSEYRGRRIAVPTADNANLVLGAIENMTGAGGLAGLRARAKASRPFLVIQDLLRAAEMQYLEEEQRLKTELQASEQRLADMERPEAGVPKPEGGAGESLVTPEQEAEIQHARARIAQTRGALRAVQHSLRQDVETLQDRLRLINIALTPFLAGVAAFALAQLRNYRRKRRSLAWRARQSIMREDAS